MLAGVFHLAGRRLLRCSDVIDAKPPAKARHQHHLLFRVWRNALAPIIGERARFFKMPRPIHCLRVEVLRPVFDSEKSRVQSRSSDFA
jgi:hypothetical protein